MTGFSASRRDGPNCGSCEIIAPDPGAPSPGTMEIGDESARVWIINGDRIDIDRAASEVRLATTSPLSDDAVLHPYLAFPAAVVSFWLGRRVFHGGAFLHGNRAWGLFAAKAGGKS